MKKKCFAFFCMLSVSLVYIYVFVFYNHRLYELIYYCRKKIYLSHNCVCLQLIMNAVTLFYIRILKITQLKGKKKHALFLPFVENNNRRYFYRFAVCNRPFIL